MTTQTPPDALLLIAPGCPHCPVVLEGLSQLLKQARIGRLQVVNIAAHPEVAAELGVRSVPWCRLGEFELEGSHTPAELAHWVELSGRPDGVRRYLAEHLQSGQLTRVIRAIELHPDWLAEAVALLGEAESGISIKLGLGALLEDLAGQAAFQAQVPLLAGLLDHPSASVRADAAHYLGLTRSPEALPHLQRALGDPDPEVREIAQEALTELQAFGVV